MAPSNGIGEVSEVRFQVLNVGVLDAVGCL